MINSVPLVNDFRVCMCDDRHQSTKRVLLALMFPGLNFRSIQHS